MISNKKNEEDPDGKMLDVSVPNLKTQSTYTSLSVTGFKGQILSVPEYKAHGKQEGGKDRAEGGRSQMLREKEVRYGGSSQPGGATKSSEESLGNGDNCHKNGDSRSAACDSVPGSSLCRAGQQS